MRGGRAAGPRRGARAVGAAGPPPWPPGRRGRRGEEVEEEKKGGEGRESANACRQPRRLPAPRPPAAPQREPWRRRPRARLEAARPGPLTSRRDGAEPCTEAIYRSTSALLRLIAPPTRVRARDAST